MRVNIYSQELTDELMIIQETSNTGHVYTGLRFVLHSSERLHNTLMDDDRSGVTFWLPRSAERRKALARTFFDAIVAISAAPPEVEEDEEFYCSDNEGSKEE